jgi:hypothetical protein
MTTLTAPMRNPLVGAVRRVWLSDRAIRLGCVPLDLTAAALIGLGRAAAYVQREREALNNG